MIDKSNEFLALSVESGPLVIDRRRSPDLMNCRVDNPHGAINNDIGIEKNSNVGAGQAIVAIHQLGDRFFLLGDSGSGLLPGRVWLAPVLNGWYGFENDYLTFHFFDDSEDLVDDPTYEWDFGDGTTSSDKNPEHTYTSSVDVPDRVKQVITDGDGTVHEKELVIEKPPGGIGGSVTTYPVVDSVTPDELGYGESDTLVIAGSNFPKFKVRHVVIYNSTDVIYPDFTVYSGNQINCTYTGNLPVGTYTVGVLLMSKDKDNPLAGHYGELADALEIVYELEDAYVQVAAMSPADADYNYGILTRTGITNGHGDAGYTSTNRTLIKTPSIYTNKTLHLFCYYTRQHSMSWRTLGIYEIDPDDWEEEVITWNNQPSLGALIDTKTPSDAWNGSWQTFDIGTVESICLKFVDETSPGPSNHLNIYFRSREYADSDYHPYISEA